MPSKLSTRSWGTRFDPLPPPSPPSSFTPAPSDTTTTQPPASTDHSVNMGEKLPHNASVFVGSLPSHIDHNELGLLLSNHLAEYAQVKSVKVIRDSKGGVCAFVQCQDADSAAKLIQNLHSTAPKPFFGRTLRFEPARAYRSLLISYRFVAFAGCDERLNSSIISTPTQVISPTDNGALPEKTIVELTLPFAMRITKLKSAKNADICYNDQAIHLTKLAKENPNSSHFIALFKQPLLCNVDTLKEICGFFGPLEHFRQYKAEGHHGGDHENPSSFPSPHNAPRNPDMAQGCFDVKWAHRDDCLSALMTLRRVPHLTVTWAHSQPDREFHAGRYNPPYPLFLQKHTDSALTGSSHSPSIDGAFPHSNVKSNDRKAPLRHLSLDQDITSMSQISNGVDLKSDEGVAWLDTDFPPLLARKADLSKSDFGGVWVEKKLSVEAEKGKDQGGFVDGPSVQSVSFGVPSRSVLSEDILLPSLSSTSHRSSVSISSTLADVGQDVESHSTPALARSPVTPKTPNSLVPPTPTSFHVEGPTQLFSKGVDGEIPYSSEEILSSDGKILDRMSLFVGGLESRTCDDRKVFDIFGKFGGLVNVKVIRPSIFRRSPSRLDVDSFQGSGKAAFAFVKFNNTESPLNAISQLHNRIIDGRAIRVQLRDCAPSRSPHRVTRNKGRHSSFNHGNQSYENSTCEPKRDKSVEASFSADEVSSEAPGEFQPSLMEDAKVGTGDELVFASHTDAEPSPQALRSSETFREWYEVGNDQPPASAATPSTGGPSVAEGGPGLPYPVPFFGPWMQPLPPPPPPPPHMQFPGSYFPHMYPITPSQPPVRYPSSSGSDQGAMPWYIPYHSYPPRPTDSSLQGQEQAPVVPTGFFQNETGTLVPVYPRAIIDQYMSNNPNQNGSSPAGVPVAIPTAVMPGAPTSPVPVQTWPQSVLPPPLGPNQLPSRPGPFLNQVPGLPISSPGWISGPIPGHSVHGLAPLGNVPMIGMPPFRDAFHGRTGPGNGNKRQGRREQLHGRGRNTVHRGRTSNASHGNPHQGQALVNRDVQSNNSTGDWTCWPEMLPEGGKIIS
ncbi:hypothetical protein GYMLUDRAFT_973996 [Collybiopsis luxurians FD-317 M1]|nr:hypothetical protein GYMLUDRAFT_973996 [Collybiopsis luxurians FD-317 M1]